MNSAFYEGVVRHVRTRPSRHELTMSVMLAYIDLDELDSAFEDDVRFGRGPFAVARFDRRDHVGADAPSLAEHVRALVRARLGFTPDGAVRLLTHLRYFGVGFNPVSFFYCFDRAEQLVAVVSEVNNTPWNETHCYVHDARGAGGEVRDRFEKRFHVSPFMPMRQDYDWRFTLPGEELSVRMTSLDDEGPLFHASMQLERRPLDRAHRSRLLLRYPWLTVQVLVAIYAHAAVLRLRGTRYVPHPDHPRHRGPKAPLEPHVLPGALR